MKTFGKKLTTPLAFTAAISAASCAPVQEPKEPQQPVVVEIEGPQRELVQTSSFHPDEKLPAKPEPKERTREEQIHFILKNVTSQTRAAVESEIEQLKFIFPGRYAECRMTDRVEEARMFAREEEKRFEEANPEKLYLCTSQHNTMLEWDRCRNEAFDEHTPLRSIRKYAQQIIVECMEGHQ